MSKSSQPKILLAGGSGDIYEQLLLVTFLDSSYFETSTVYDGKLGLITVVISEFGCEKFKFEFLAGKLKFEVPATFVAFTNFWGCLDDELMISNFKN